MTNHQYVQVERTLLKRGVTDFERKLKAAAASGALGYALVTVLAAFGIHLPTQVAELIPVAVAILGGYITHSSAVTTTFSDTNDGYSVRVGPAGTPVGEPKPLTGALPIPAPLPPQPAAPAQPPADPPLPEVPDQASFTAVVSPADAGADSATKVYSPGAAFWAARADSTDHGLNGN